VLSDAPTASLGVDITLQSVDGALVVRLSMQPSLVTRVINQLLQRQPAFEDPRQPLDERTVGLATALALDVAERAAVTTPLVLAEAPSDETGGVLFSLAFAVGDQRYAGTAWLSSRRDATDWARPRALLTLGDLPVAVALCVGLSKAGRADLQRLGVGDVWLPGEGFWLREGLGFAALVAPSAEMGVKVELTRSGVVYHGDPVTIPTDADDSPAPADEEHTGDLQEVVLDSPVVVRLELGKVSLTAREWAEVNVGDVLDTRQPVGTAVVLRVAGREVATGQLVTVDGEIGVRITELRR